MSDKTQPISIRIPQKFKYLAQLLAQKRRSSVSDTVAFCIENSGRRLLDEQDPGFIDKLWDPHPAERLFKLEKIRPAWLSLQEEVLLKRIKAHSDCWRNGEPDFQQIHEKWKQLEAERDAHIQGLVDIGELEPTSKMKPRRNKQEALKFAREALEGVLQKPIEESVFLKLVDSVKDST